MKKLFAVLLSIAMILCFTACGKEDVPTIDAVVDIPLEEEVIDASEDVIDIPVEENLEAGSK